MKKKAMTIVRSNQRQGTAFYDTVLTVDMMDCFTFFNQEKFIIIMIVKQLCMLLQNIAVLKENFRRIRRIIRLIP